MPKCTMLIPCFIFHVYHGIIRRDGATVYVLLFTVKYHGIIPLLWHDRQVMQSVIELFVSVVGRFLKNAWNKEPVITVSCGIGLLGEIITVHHHILDLYLPTL